MNMKRRLLALLTSLVLVVSLTSCQDGGKGQQGPSGNTSNPGSTDGEVVLQWMPAYLNPAVVKKYVDEFNASQDRITVTVVEATFGSVSDYTSALAMNVAGGNGAYDIFSMSAADFNKYVSSGVAYCLDDHLLNSEDVKSYALELVTRNGHVYGYPATNDTIGVYVNLDMLKLSGHTLEDLETWDGMLEAATDIARTSGNYGCLTHLGFGGGYAEFLWYATLWSAGGDITMDLDGNITVVNSDALAEAAKDWRALIRSEAGSTEFNNDIDYFYNGLCGMVITGQTALSEIDEYLSGGYSFDWTFIPIPAAEKGGQSYSPFGGWFTVINARNDHAAEAAEFMDYLYFETDYIADMCRNYYQISPLYSADAKLGDLYSTYLGMVYDYIDNGDIVCKAEIALDSTVLEELGKMLSSVIYQSTNDSEVDAYVDRFVKNVNAQVVN